VLTPSEIAQVETDSNQTEHDTEIRKEKSENKEAI
jgi:hypothetical protein